jgi:tryptophanase
MTILDEPYAVSAISPLPLLSFDERWAALEAAHFDVEGLAQSAVTLDLVIDSGLSALSDAQVSALSRWPHVAGESEPFRMLEAAVRDLVGEAYVLPLAKGRAAEHVLFGALLEPGKGCSVVLGNSFFDTTKDNVLHHGGQVEEVGRVFDSVRHAEPFAGNVDVRRLDEALERGGSRVAAVLVTMTTVAGGHPVSKANLAAVRQRCVRAGVPLVLDACRFAENAALLQRREAGLAQVPVREIVQSLFGLADVVYFSAAKDALSPTGGVLAVRDGELFSAVTRRAHHLYGYKYSGGLSANLVAVIAQGLWESTDERMLTHRLAVMEHTVHAFEEGGFTPWTPSGGHAIFVSAHGLAPHLAEAEFPAHAFLGALYLVSGTRAGFFYRGRSAGGLRAALPSAEGCQDVRTFSAIRFCVPRRKVTAEQMRGVVRDVTATAAVMRAHAGFRQVGDGPSGQPRLAFATASAREQFLSAVRETRSRKGDPEAA